MPLNQNLKYGRQILYSSSIEREKLLKEAIEELISRLQKLSPTFKNSIKFYELTQILNITNVNTQRKRKSSLDYLDGKTHNTGSKTLIKAIELSSISSPNKACYIIINSIIHRASRSARPAACSFHDGVGTPIRMEF